MKDPIVWKILPSSQGKVCLYLFFPEFSSYFSCSEHLTIHHVLSFGHYTYKLEGTANSSLSFPRLLFSLDPQLETERSRTDTGASKTTHYKTAWRLVNLLILLVRKLKLSLERPRWPSRNTWLVIYKWN